MSATAFQRMRREAEKCKAMELEQSKEAANNTNEEPDLKKLAQEMPKQEINYAELTNEQLKELLGEKCVEYKARATKTELVELLQGTV